MAANKFATMLYRNTNKMTLVLVYAALEWTLIILLLLNSLFSYLIMRFADYFGLQRPCLWCSRLDHIIASGKNKSSYRDLVCEVHASEISKLSYCRKHHRLAESQDMCEDCLTSSQSDTMVARNLGHYQWMKQMIMIQEAADKALEKCEERLSCCCCGLKFDSRLYPPCNLVKPSWDAFDFTQKQNLIAETEVSTKKSEGPHWEQSRSDFVIDHDDEQSNEEHRGGHIVTDLDGGSCKKKEEAEGSCACSVCDGLKEMSAVEFEKVYMIVEKEKEVIKEKDLGVRMNDEACEKNTVNVAVSIKDTSHEALPRHLEFYIDEEDCQLIPVELIDAFSAEDKNRNRIYVEEQANEGNEDFVLDLGMHVELDKKFSPAEEQVSLENPENQQVTQDRHTYELPANEDDVGKTGGRMQGQNSDDHQVSEGAMEPRDYESEHEVSIGSEIPEREPEVDGDKSQGILPGSHDHMEGYPSINFNFQITSNYNGSLNTEEKFLEFQTMSVKPSVHCVDFSSCFKFNENDENLACSMRIEDSVDGSEVSDVDGAELTDEKLKSALRTKRIALHALCAELEAERNASAVAASQTMAMINRLQEEKSAMQMEALQYQRMMEEQSEYDQEALLLLNELIVKKDKENQELEKVLGVYRRKVQEYEDRGRMVMSRREGITRSRSSSLSCTNANDRDELSVGLNHEVKAAENIEEIAIHSTPVDAVLYMEESMANLEEERLSILEQLKVLEEKLFILNHEEEELEDIKSSEHIHEQNGNAYHQNSDSESEVNGCTNGRAKETKGKNKQERKIIGVKSKTLLPLFDAEIEDGVLHRDNNGIDMTSYSKFQMVKRIIALEGEVGHVYERMQALEADREFLKHCFSSLRKGDKGLRLLQEILQHLHDLRNVEDRLKNMSDGPLWSM